MDLFVERNEIERQIPMAHIRRLRLSGAILVSFGALAACGDTVGEQALYGAGAGLGASLLVDGNLATGAAVGAAANLVYCQQNPGKC